MSRLVRLAAVAAFVVSVWLWAGGTLSPDVVVAQSTGAIMVTRVHTGADGLAYAEEVEMPRNADGRYDTVEVTGVQFSSRRPSTGGDWHTAPGAST